MKIKAVIFDLDGTLYDNTKLPRHIILHSLFNLRMLYAERMCRHHMSGRYYGGKGATYDELFRRMSAMTGRSVQAVEEWYWGKFMPLQVRLLKKFFHKKAWVDSTLSSLREQGVKLACFSEYSFIKEKLKALNISPESFDLLIDAPMAGGCKPCRKAFVYVAKKLSVHPANILMVGDREDTDGAGAEACHMQFLLVSKADSKNLDLRCE